MAKKTISTSFVRIKHRMSDDEKRLFCILFEHALPELHSKSEHAIHPKELIKLWRPELETIEHGQLYLERAFWHLGATITYECTVNPQRPSWGTFALFYGRSIKEDGIYYYSYNKEFKKYLSYPIVYKQLLQEGFIIEIPEHQPASSESAAAYRVAL